MKAILVALSVLALAACTPASQSGAGHGSAAAMATSTAAAPQPAAAASGNGASDVPSRLTAFHWQLARATDKSGARIDALFARDDRPLQLDFDANNLFVGNTCNRMRGSWSLADGKLVIGRLASTLMACNDARLMALDTAAGTYLAGTLRLTLAVHADQPQLALADDQGDTLEFVGLPTAETRYGSAGETRFLEIAAQTGPCAATDAAGAACLQVRELYYDADGLRTGQPGPWHALQDIAGYTHVPDTRNVVRVKRYKLTDAPAGASSAAYVLDMVVESQRPPQ